MSAATIRRIFVSSTAEDLGEHRTRVFEAMMLLGLHPVAMEFFGARPGAPVEECRALAAGASAVVVIVAHRFGWVPSPEEGGDGTRSITWLEVDAAETAATPVFAFLVDPAFAWPHGREQDSLVDAGDEETALRAFRRVQGLKRLRTTLETRVRARFSTPEDLAYKVTSSVSRWILESAPQAEGLQLAELRYVHRYLNPRGDYELRATYVVENRGQQDTSRLPPDQIRFFVPEDRSLAELVTLEYELPPGSRHHIHGRLLFDEPERVALPDGAPERTVGTVYWHPLVAPPIPAGGSLTYTCLVRGTGTDSDVFGHAGSYAGIATRLPTGRLVMRCEAPTGYRFDAAAITPLPSTDTHATVLIEGLPHVETTPGGDALIWTLERPALRVNVHYDLKLRILPAAGSA
jgi:hypothetical protein